MAVGMLCYFALPHTHGRIIHICVANRLRLESNSCCWIFILCERRLKETTEAGQKENDSLKRDRTSYARIHEQMQCGIFFAWVRERAYTIPKRLKSSLALVFLTSLFANEKKKTHTKSRTNKKNNINELLPFSLFRFRFYLETPFFLSACYCVSCFLRRMHLLVLPSLRPIRKHKMYEIWLCMRMFLSTHLIVVK